VRSANGVGQKFRLGARGLDWYCDDGSPLEWSFRPCRITRVFQVLSVDAIDKD